MNDDYYLEKCNNNTMMTYSFFFDKLKQIESLVDVISIRKLNNTTCSICSKSKYYKLSNIIWSDQLVHIVNFHKTYPSEYFIKVILNTIIINGHIINKPIEISPNRISDFSYISVYYNKLLIIDALLKQGSYPRYENYSGQYIYSEHSGALTIKNNIIDNIIIHTNTNRSDPTDQTIFLPNNTSDLINYEYLFHTHPNTKKYAGRINEGVLYEFPSANDIFNYIKYHSEGKTQGSIIIAPEGTYVIRLINFEHKINYDEKLYHDLKNLILELEYQSINKLKKIATKLSDPDIFHKKVASNFTYINQYNKFIEPYNIYVEYYPREKKNNEWCLRPITLMYIESKEDNKSFLDQTHQ